MLWWIKRGCIYKAPNTVQPGVGIQKMQVFVFYNDINDREV